MEIKNIELNRYCYFCGKKFIAKHGKIIYCKDFCEYLNWRETTKAKALRSQRKTKASLEGERLEWK